MGLKSKAKILFSLSFYKMILNYIGDHGIKSFFKRINCKLFKSLRTYNNWYLIHLPSRNLLRKQCKNSIRFGIKFLLIINLTNVSFSKKLFMQMLKSLNGNSYTKWSAVVYCNRRNYNYINEILSKYEKFEIKVIDSSDYLSEINNLIQCINNEFLIFLEDYCFLAEEAMYKFAQYIFKNDKCKIAYSDSDEYIKGIYKNPNFKPDFNIDMLRSFNYIYSSLVIDSALVKELGYFSENYIVSYLYEFVFRCVDENVEIYHVPNVLYHHSNVYLKKINNSSEEEINIIHKHLARNNIDASIEKTKYNRVYKLNIKIKESPLISVIIPSKDNVNCLKKCIDSLLNNNYKNIEIIIVENNSVKNETFDYYEAVKMSNKNIKIINFKNNVFNYSKLNNYAVNKCNGEYLLLLNNDTEIINPDSISEMLMHCQRDDVGAVGAKMYFEDGTIQHSGVILGIRGVAGHCFRLQPHDSLGFQYRTFLVQDLCAVTAACLMVRKKNYYLVGNFDEDLSVCFNDVDFCLKLRAKGLLNVFTPYSELTHFESKSRGEDISEEKQKRFNSEVAYFQNKWHKELNEGDPNYNINLSLNNDNFELEF